MALTHNETTVKRGFWPKLARVLASVPFAEEVAAAYFCAFDPKTPIRAKGILLAALGYFILPFDIIPDFVLGVGFTDDMAVVAAAIGMIANHMTEEHRTRARAALAKLKSGEQFSG